MRQVKAKKLRRAVRRQVKLVVGEHLLPMYAQPFHLRVKLAWRIILGKPPREEARYAE